jgi:L-alanine-DL-glutamate epimerase-like enolase superfamily enzyme
MWATLFTRRPEIKGGELILRDDPGWGLDLNEETLKKHGVWA